MYWAATIAGAADFAGNNRANGLVDFQGDTVLGGLHRAQTVCIQSVSLTLAVGETCDPRLVLQHPTRPGEEQVLFASTGVNNFRLSNIIVPRDTIVEPAGTAQEHANTPQVFKLILTTANKTGDGSLVVHWTKVPDGG